MIKLIRKHPLITIAVIVIVVANFFLQRYLNTLVWPYLWPRPAIFILMALFGLAVWFPRLFSGTWALRISGLWMIFIGQSYLLHSFEVLVTQFSPVALIHFLGIAGTYSVMVVSYINQALPKDVRKAPALPDDLPYVAAVIPTYGEPVDILEETALSLKELDYPQDRLYIFISDDGHREEVQRMAEYHGIGYNPGARKDAKAGNLNSALKHLEEFFPQAALILTQDADEVIDSTFLKKTVGYFTDPEIAFVQTPKEAIAPPGDPFGVRDRIFYDVIQPGRNGSGAAFSCGSGVLWRIEAVKSIGGYATWNVVEDLTTSYFLHCAGWRSAYHNEVLTLGLAPDDLPGLLKQRGTWAVDTWRLFLFKNPLVMPGLKPRQRLQYLELGLFYTTSTFFMPLLMLTPLLSLLTGQFVPIEGSALFPWLVISVLYYASLARGFHEFFKRMWQYWVGHCPTYAKAFWIAIRSKNKKPSYKVTRKTRQAGFYGQMIWPQYLYLLVGIIAIVNALFFMPAVDLGARLTNIGILLFFMYMVSGIVEASLYGVQFIAPRRALVKMRRRLAYTFAGLRGIRVAGDSVQSPSGAD
ncbi:MAG: glycosyltransferase [Chloroflexi bacterium]|nr:glycosyltransferase [Chloroflexota bacterium]MDL1882348.1 glycosyltransferase [Anaerolineae bacterium CFX8]